MTGAPVPGFACGSCLGSLVRDAGSLRCVQCGRLYPFNRHGFAEVLPPDLIHDSQAIDATTVDYAWSQHETGVRVLRDYLQPFLAREACRTVLDVGCGIGAAVAALSVAGYEAYGLDLPALAPFWAEGRNDPGHFVCGNALRLPFASDFFDVVYSLGVIEHIGTVIGHCTLRTDFQTHRERYAREIVRVTKPGGRILIACPNKTFPVDIQHGPTDGAGPRSRLRAMLFNNTGINLHKTWGRYHLLSHGEVRRLFCHDGGARGFRALPLAGYFAFGRFQNGFLRPLGRLAELYVTHLPGVLRATSFNPYVMVEIRKPSSQAS